VRPLGNLRRGEPHDERAVSDSQSHVCRMHRRNLHVEHQSADVQRVDRVPTG
jgi:hypothetical protein